MYTINRFVLQESGKVVEGCLTVKNYWGLLTGDDEVGLEIADILVGQIGFLSDPLRASASSFFS